MTNKILIDLGQGERGEQRRAALEEMAMEYGYEWGGNPSIGRLVVALADRYKESKMSEKLSVRYGFHGADLFAGWDDEGVYNVPESAQRYADLVEAVLREQFIDAEIEVVFDLDAGGCLPLPMMAAVNGQTDHADVGIIDYVAGLVYEEYEWAVAAS